MNNTIEVNGVTKAERLHAQAMFKFATNNLGCNEDLAVSAIVAFYSEDSSLYRDLEALEVKLIDLSNK